MKISIITVCRNSEETIEHTLRSVLAQEDIDLEFIVIDGGSTDSTMKIIGNYSENISTIISEKDNGMYDALNKGIALASGEVIGILHSDDFYASSQILSSVIRAFVSDGIDAVYGDLQYVAKENPDKIIRNWIAGPYTDGLFLKGWMPPHPAFFARRRCYEKFGRFNTEFKTASDYELMLRFIHKEKIKLAYIPLVLVKMRVGGKSNLSIANRIRANREDRLAWKINGLRPGFFTLSIKPLSKLKQFFFRSNSIH
jgi:glycosyltransferase involved in cell wall biosynthesis